jgi:hypothetical protein
MKISLNSGFLPSLSVPAGLLGLYLSRAWIRILDCFDVSQIPFTRQENTVIQTCVVACSVIAFSGMYIYVLIQKSTIYICVLDHLVAYVYIYIGGFGTYILAMGSKAAEGDASGETNIADPTVGRLVPFLLLVSLSGVFILMPFRKLMIIRHRLTFPSAALYIDIY